MPDTDTPSAVRPRNPSPSIASPCGLASVNEPEPDEPTVSRLVTAPEAGASTEPVNAVSSVAPSPLAPYAVTAISPLVV
jgi:hypothetical protein